MKENGEGMTRRSIVEEKIPVDALPGSLFCSQVFGARSTTAHLAPGFACDFLWGTVHDVPHTERDGASGMDFDLIGTVFIDFVHFLLSGAGDARKANTWHDVV